MFARCLVGVLLLAAAPGQRRISAVAEVLGAGEELKAGTPVGVLDRRGFEAVLAAHGREVPDIELAGRRLVLLELGAGPGGLIDVAGVYHAAGEYLVRIEGRSRVRYAERRWAVVAVPSMTNVVFEANCVIPGHGVAFRRCGTVSAPRCLFESHETVVFPAAGELALLCIADACDMRRFVSEQLAKDCRAEALERFARIDFLRFVALARPLAATDVVEIFGKKQAVSPSLFRANKGSLLRIPTSAGRGELHSYGITFVPRTAGALDCEAQVPGAADTWQRVARFDVPDPFTAPKLPILRFVQRDMEACEKSIVRRASTHSEWTELRKEFDEFADLPDDWCDFNDTSVIAVVTAAARVFRGFELSVGVEEGVDVLTAHQWGPSGVDPGQNSFGLLVVVPNRKGQLAVVLSRKFGPGAGGEETLRLFPGFGR